MLLREVYSFFQTIYERIGYFSIKKDALGFFYIPLLYDFVRINLSFTKGLFYRNGVALFDLLNAVYTEIFKSLLGRFARILGGILIF